MNLIKITSVEQLTHYKEDWSIILEEIQNTNPFIEFEWVYEWWSYLGSEMNVEITAVQSGNRIVAFFPFVYTKKWFGYEYNFMALGQANYMDFIAYKYVLDKAIAFVFDDIIQTRKKVLFNLHGLLESGLTPGKLEIYLKNKGIESRTYRIVTPFVDLENIKIDDYMKERKTLHGLDRRQKRLRALGAVRLTTSKAEEMDYVFHLHNKRWEKKNDTSGFTNKERRAFFRRLAEVNGGAMSVQIESLYLEDKLIAFTYGFKCRGRYMGYVLGHDNSFDFFSPGRILVKEKIKKSVQSPIKILDMSIGYEPYKFEWNTGLDHARRIVFSSNSTSAKCARNFIWAKERLLSNIKKSRTAVLFRRNTLGKVKYILRNLKSRQTFKKVKPDIDIFFKRIQDFIYYRNQHTIMKIKTESISPPMSNQSYTQLTIKKVFDQVSLEDKDIKKIGERLYRGFSGYYTGEPVPYNELFWINQNVIRVDNISYLEQLRKGIIYIEKWNTGNVLEICAFVKKVYKAKVIVIDLADPTKETLETLKKKGFSIDKVIYNRTYLGFKKSKIINSNAGSV